MSKRDDFSDEPDWETADRAYREWNQERETRELMTHGDYSATVRVHGRIRPKR